MKDHAPMIERAVKKTVRRIRPALEANEVATMLFLWKIRRSAQVECTSTSVKRRPFANLKRIPDTFLGRG